MKRTSLLLPAQLRNRAQLRALQLEISFGETIRQALTQWLASQEAAETAETADAVFDAAIVHDGEASADLAARHDEHLYG